MAVRSPPLVNLALEHYYNSSAGALYLRYQLGRPHVDHLFKTEEYEGPVEKFLCAFCGYNSTLDGFGEILAKVEGYYMPLDEYFFRNVRHVSYIVSKNQFLSL